MESIDDSWEKSIKIYNSESKNQNSQFSKAGKRNNETKSNFLKDKKKKSRSFRI